MANIERLGDTYHMIQMTDKSQITKLRETLLFLTLFLAPFQFSSLGNSHIILHRSSLDRNGEFTKQHCFCLHI